MKFWRKLQTLIPKRDENLIQDKKYRDMIIPGNITGLPSPVAGALIICVFLVYTFILFNKPLQDLATNFRTEVFYFTFVILFFLHFFFHKKLYMILCGILALLIAGIFNFFFSTNAGDPILFMIMAAFTYRLPLRWSFLILCLLSVFIGSEHHIYEYLQLRTIFMNIGTWSTIGTFVFIFIIAFSLRTRHLLILQLQEIQHRLLYEMERSSEMATVQERTRIARDIHDVLAHSLTAIFFQLQATGELQKTQPEKVPAKLEEIAALTRESIIESRSVVGLLREASRPIGQNRVDQHLQGVQESFGHRMGIQTTFQEVGTPQLLDNTKMGVLHFMLYEALTNAHRHGAATEVQTTLLWEEQTVSLTVNDNGTNALTPFAFVRGTGNGLRGMSERSIGQQGKMNAHFKPEGGFFVSVSLPT